MFLIILHYILYQELRKYYMFLIIYFVLWSDAAKFATGDWTAEEAAQVNVRSTKEKNRFKTKMSIYLFSREK
jgi:hypothetical protein